MFKTKKEQSVAETNSAASAPAGLQYTSGDVARIAGVSLRQLQWWDERNVVSPLQEGHRRVYRQQEVIEVSVSDTGLGVPAEYLGKIFDPFFTTKAVGEGAGLGLSISFGIIERHGGSIDVASVPGEGATFTVRIPIHPPKQETTES